MYLVQRPKHSRQTHLKGKVQGPYWGTPEPSGSGPYDSCLMSPCHCLPQASGSNSFSSALILSRLYGSYWPLITWLVLTILLDSLKSHLEEPSLILLFFRVYFYDCTYWSCNLPHKTLSFLRTWPYLTYLYIPRASWSTRNTCSPNEQPQIPKLHPNKTIWSYI